MAFNFNPITLVIFLHFLEIFLMFLDNLLMDRMQHNIIESLNPLLISLLDKLLQVIPLLFHKVPLHWELEMLLSFQQILLKANNLLRFPGKFNFHIKKFLTSDRFATNLWDKIVLSLAHHYLRFLIAIQLSLLALISVIGNAKCNVRFLSFTALLSYFKENHTCNYLKIELQHRDYQLNLEELSTRLS